MPRVLQTHRAEIDLIDIWLQVAEHSPLAADDLLRRIAEKCELLAAQPFMGEARENLAKRMRAFPVGSYVIFYRPIDDGIEVNRVLSGYRDVDRLFT